MLLAHLSRSGIVMSEAAAVFPLPLQAETAVSRCAAGKAASLALKHSILQLLYIAADRMPIPRKYLLVRLSIMPQRH